MKKISYRELGEYFGELAQKEFGVWFSDDIRDYENDFCSEPTCIEETEEYSLYEYHIELTYNLKVLNIPFYIKTINNENGTYYEEYYI